ncbi:MAG: histidine phosphatase family protein [Candidatus Omnitrophica bacterium]|nr:histidine phosphatase family protein [Candidatus Omnitrophota bacterium]
MPTKVILIRHGETEWNRRKRYMGHSDIDLNRRGKRQAAGARRLLKHTRVDKIYSSDLKRAFNTARIVFGDVPIETKKQLREMRLGRWEGMTYAMLMKKYGNIYRGWLEDPYAANIPSAETMSEFSGRIRKMFKKIVTKDKNKTVAIVTHGGPIGIILKEVRKSGSVLGYIPKPGSVTVITLE